MTNKNKNTNTFIDTLHAHTNSSPKSRFVVENKQQLQLTKPKGLVAWLTPSTMEQLIHSFQGGYIGYNRKLQVSDMINHTSYIKQ